MNSVNDPVSPFFSPVVATSDVYSQNELNRVVDDVLAGLPDL